MWASPVPSVQLMRRPSSNARAPEDILRAVTTTCSGLCATARALTAKAASTSFGNPSPAQIGMKSTEPSWRATRATGSSVASMSVNLPRKFSGNARLISSAARFSLSFTELMHRDFSVTASMNNRFTVQERPHNKKLWSSTRLVDLFAADEGRDFLFSPPGAGVVDLALLTTLQRPVFYSTGSSDS